MMVNSQSISHSLGLNTSFSSDADGFTKDFMFMQKIITDFFFHGRPFSNNTTG